MICAGLCRGDTGLAFKALCASMFGGGACTAYAGTAQLLDGLCRLVEGDTGLAFKAPYASMFGVDACFDMCHHSSIPQEPLKGLCRLVEG
jgi:hypothetical protein